MKRTLRQSYWWPRQDHDVETFVKHCSGCQSSDKSLAPAHVPSFSIPTPDTPWQKLAIDVTGPFLIAPNCSKFLVVLLDYHTKYPKILMTPTITSQKITD
ncbi:Gypsy retrotransposon integrase-like protein 1 [Elysia marginata]|uniref:Gypsy retrotransposon integrase-like protein 1 n=1 Tax=Elysia marginata TaxID=1093978 RepID=A0AAV4I6W6_9GAST|nr:Gypsy retrotransposon integrase-like protein 1 [Elysia marginata]